MTFSPKTREARSDRNLPEWLNHPWTIAIGATVLTMLLTQVSPWHLLSRRLWPHVYVALHYLEEAIAVPRWFAPALLFTGATVNLLVQYVYKLLRKKRTRLIFAGLTWNRATQEGGFRPICIRCKALMQPRIQPEQRTDRNKVPFLFVPEDANVLSCLRCESNIALSEPWPELVRKANEFLSSI
jgi:hypothetical protein